MNYPNGTMYRSDAPWNAKDHFMECPQSADFEPEMDFLWDVYHAAQRAWDTGQVKSLRLLDCTCDVIAEDMTWAAEDRRYPEI